MGNPWESTGTPAFKNYRESIKQYGLENVNYDDRLKYYKENSLPEVAEKIETIPRDCERIEMFHRTQKGEKWNMVLEDIIDEMLLDYAPGEVISGELEQLIYRTNSDMGKYLGYKTVTNPDGSQYVETVKEMENR